jgi:uncharacterized protein YjeT (DUF2065 family)
MTKRLSTYLLTAACSLVPLVTLAQTLGMPAPKFGSMSDFIVRLIDIVQILGLGTAVLWLLFSGFMLVASRGDETALPDAKKRFLIALCVVLVLTGLKVAWGVIGGTYAALGFMAAIFLILFVLWGMK